MMQNPDTFIIFFFKLHLSKAVALCVWVRLKFLMSVTNPRN